MRNPMQGISKPGRPVKSNADRQAEFVAKRSEVGPIPQPADPARREACRLDLRLFGVTYCLGDGEGFLLRHEPSDLMVPYIEAVQSSHLSGEMVHPRFPRGKGKTAWLKIGDIWAVSYGHSKFIVTAAANQDNADAILDDIWDFWEECEPYGADFPEVALPVRALEGHMQRCPVQTVDGKRTKIKRSRDRIYLPRIDGAPCSGAIIVSRGREAGIRGIVKGSQRPDHFGIDDPQNDKTAKSESQSTDIINWIHQSVLGLSGHNKRSGAVLTTTPIRAGDVSEQCADFDLHPQWKTISIPLVLRWPDNAVLWDEYLELCRRDKLEGKPTFPTATEFYKRWRTEMDLGARVLDPKDGDPATELSAIQHAYNLLFTVGREAFEAEYQLAPVKSAAAFELSAKAVSANISLTGRLVMPKDCHAAVAFVDCHRHDALRWVVVAVGSQRRAVVLAYGKYPDDRELFPANSTTPVQNKALAQELHALIEQLATLPIKKASGTTAVCGIGIDRGWKPRIVEWVCSRSKRKDLLWPTLGYNAQRYAPERIDGKARENVMGIGDHCYLAQGKGFRYIGQNVDYWKEYTQRSFIAPAMTAGATAFYGDDPLAHYDFACEIVAERLVDKGRGANGTEWWKWVLKPGAKNHGLDEVSGALMLASHLRLYDASQVTAPGAAATAAAKKRRSRVKLIRR